MDELKSKIREKAVLAEQSFHEWEKESPGCAQASFRSGMAFALLEVENLIDQCQ